VQTVNQPANPEAGLSIKLYKCPLKGQYNTMGNFIFH